MNFDRSRSSSNPTLNNNDNIFPFLGLTLLGGAAVCGAILFVAAVRAWRQIYSGRKKEKGDGLPSMKSAKTTDLEDEEEFRTGKSNDEKRALTGWTE